MEQNEFQGIDHIEEIDEDTQDGKYLTFSLEKEEYGIEIRHVTEIIGIQSITDLPDTPNYVKGVINLRGKVVPVMDVRLRFNMKEKEYNERTCIIVVSVRNVTVGLIVDTVSEVLDIPHEDVEHPPKVNAMAGSGYIKGLGKVDSKVKILLDTQKLLFGDDPDQITDALN